MPRFSLFSYLRLGLDLWRKLLYGFSSIICVLYTLSISRLFSIVVLWVMKQCVLDQSAETLKQSRSNLQILGARRLTSNKFQFEGPQKLVPAVKNEVARANWRQVFVL